MIARAFRESGLVKTGLSAAIVISILAVEGCAQLGLRNRVLHRVASPDGTMVAVCQELPRLDGPDYAIRLEHPNGRAIRHLYEIGKSYACSEIAWSSDGKTIGILSRHSAIVKLVDVQWALDHPRIETSHHSWREIGAGLIPPNSGRQVVARCLRFSDGDTVELELCPQSRDTARRDGNVTCSEAPVTRTVAIPRPVFDARRHYSAART